MKEKIRSQIPTECPWRDTLYWYDSVDSTNTRAKELARRGAPHGTVVIAAGQTGGRGRMGRRFESADGQGVYLSVILRPDCPAEKLMHLTCAVAVAMTEAVDTACGLMPDIKWINDLVWQKKKLGGILTELSVNPKTGRLDYAVVGVGINCLQAPEDFPPQLRSIATSLRAAGKTVSPDTLAAAMVWALHKMDGVLFAEKDRILATYRSRCITLGQQVQILRADTCIPGKALDVDAEGGLLVALSDGTQTVVSSGEVSVRGLYDYI